MTQATSAFSPIALRPVFYDAGIDKAVIDHRREIERRHVGHAAIGVAFVDIAAEQRILFAGRLGRLNRSSEIGNWPS